MIRDEYSLTGVALLRALRPMNVRNGALFRAGQLCDGGYVMIEPPSDSICYSFGISDEISWDMDMAARGLPVFQYDHTVEAPGGSDLFTFFSVGLCGIGVQRENMCDISQILEANGHLGRDKIVLKMDIEDSEWEFIETVPAGIVQQFSQIILEIHLLDQNLPYKIQLLNKLNLTHQVIHVHGNNYGKLSGYGGVVFPETFEVTYVRRADHVFETATQIFPTGLDYPCAYDKPDYFLGRLGLL